MEGHLCQGGLTKGKQLLQFPTHQLDLGTLSVLPEGVVQKMDMNMNLDMLGNEEEEDPLQKVKIIFHTCHVFYYENQYLHIWT